MSAAPWYLGVDLGTGGVKVAAVHPDGTILASAFVSIDTTLFPDGGAEQDPESWWRGIVTTTRAVVADPAVDASTCIGVGITGQWGSTVPVDNTGRPVGPCLLWSDDRGAPWSSKLVGGRVVDVAGFDPRKILTWVRVAGGAPSPQGADPTGHHQFLRHMRRDVYESAHVLLEPVDFIGMLLTGRAAATPASMVLSWLTDNRPGAPVAYHADLVRLADRDVAKLPELVPTGSTLGPLHAHAAAELGLPAGTPVVAGVGDMHTASLGSGAVRDFEGHLAIGTTAWVSAPVPFKKTDVVRQMASVPGLRAGSYLIANNHETAGAALRWLRDRVLRGGDGLDDREFTFDEITAAAATAPPGSGGVIFTPWLKGERSPVEDRNLRASFLNVSLATERADLLRSVLEGVALNARWLVDATEKFAGRSLDGLRIVGGGALSELWCQIHADVLGRPVQQVLDPMNVNVRGAAWFAAIGLGHLTIDDIAARRPPAREFRPAPGTREVYEPLRREFVRLARDQKAMYRRLNGRGERR